MQDQNPNSSIEAFAKMDLGPHLLEAVARAGFTKPTAVQSQSIPTALRGLDLIAVAQTGSGKTLAYALAVLRFLEKSPQSRALILSPNRETVDQIFALLTKLNEKGLYSTESVSTGTPLNEQAKKLKKNPRLLIASPGRLNEHLRTNKLLLQGVEILVVDEADRMLEMGFEPQLQFIKSTLRGDRQTLMFSASFSSKADSIAKLFVKPDAVFIRVEGAGETVSTLKQRVVFLLNSQKKNRLLDELKKMKGGIILFADSQESCVELGRLLKNHQFSSDFAHGDMNSGHRNRILREFREEKIAILVTTDLLARGLDVPHVRHIVNFSLPYKSEDFLHRIGRTARAGQEGSSLTFITPGDGRSYRKIKSYLKGAKEESLMDSFRFEA